jgi:hypothetical protein
LAASKKMRGELRLVVDPAVLAALAALRRRRAALVQHALTQVDLKILEGAKLALSTMSARTFKNCNRKASVVPISDGKVNRDPA